MSDGDVNLSNAPKAFDIIRADDGSCGLFANFGALIQSPLT